MMGLRHEAAERISESGLPPNSVKAILDHYGRGSMSLGEGKNAIDLKSHIDERKEDFMQELFEDVSEAIKDDTGEKDVSFTYDTKLTFPAELTLGKIYEEAQQQLPDDYDVMNREVERDILKKIAGPLKKGKNGRTRKKRIEEEQEAQLMRLREGEAFTDLVMGLLVEGDMRDAIHDEEYEDFETDSELESPEVAETAQETLLKELQTQLEEYPEGVREAYEKAVDLSMEHQDEDEQFREMYQDARENPADAEEIIEPYRNGSTESRFTLDWSNTDMPFFASQYERVGVLYEGMFEMYEEAGFDLDEDFRRSLVLSTIGAQIWLDDVDDLAEDWENSQLTPVTAELLYSDSDEEAYENIVSLKGRYLDAARDYAERSGSHLAGIGIEYIDRRGDELDLEQQIENTQR
jgi:hypothetical protein